MVEAIVDRRAGAFRVAPVRPGFGIVKTSPPGTSISSGGFGVPGATCFLSSSQSTGRSAMVT
jgi:hypothetical protein